MRFGAPLFTPAADPETWIAALRRKGYRAAYAPVEERPAPGTVAAYVAAARRADVVIAEVGAWSNPMSPDPAIRREAIALCQRRLALAEELGARCCVNITGAVGERWDGPYPDNYGPDAFDQVVQTTREIIDAVKPTRTVYALEPMPWMLPSSIEEYQRLLSAIDRPAFGVHMDLVNLICSPQRYFGFVAFAREFIRTLGGSIVSCHLKDVLLMPELTTHLQERAPGLGGLDLGALLGMIHSQLPADTPVMLEHLPDEAAYDAAAAHVRGLAETAGIPL
ncbi:MAG: sugar phosphate isomerase/epimerase family protein [Christensenellales bacterium]|jgi:sugar phosphate isomerase/epimerase